MYEQRQTKRIACGQVMELSPRQYSQRQLGPQTATLLIACLAILVCGVWLTFGSSNAAQAHGGLRPYGISGDGGSGVGSAILPALVLAVLTMVGLMALPLAFLAGATWTTCLWQAFQIHGGRSPEDQEMYSAPMRDLTDLSQRTGGYDDASAFAQPRYYDSHQRRGGAALAHLCGAARPRGRAIPVPPLRRPLPLTRRQLTTRADKQLSGGRTRVDVLA